jgi:hypothetical protein
MDLKTPWPSLEKPAKLLNVLRKLIQGKGLTLKTYHFVKGFGKSKEKVVLISKLKKIPLKIKQHQLFVKQLTNLICNNT